MKTTFKTKDLIPALEEAIKKEEEKKEALWEEFIKEEEKRDEEYKRNLGAWRVKRKSLFSPREPMPIPPPFNWGGFKTYLYFKYRRVKGYAQICLRSQDRDSGAK